MTSRMTAPNAGTFKPRQPPPSRDTKVASSIKFFMVYHGISVSTSRRDINFSSEPASQSKLPAEFKAKRGIVVAVYDNLDQAVAYLGQYNAPGAAVPLEVFTEYDREIGLPWKVESCIINERDGSIAGKHVHDVYWIESSCDGEMAVCELESSDEDGGDDDHE